MRASKAIGTDTTKYYYDGDHVINETLNGSNYATNVLGVNGYISRKQNGTTGYLFKDAHGDALAAYSSTTSKIADYSYDAWGSAMSENETSSFTNNPLRYCGEYYDYESGMTYLRARYYDNSIRRFITEDPAKDGANWYVYGNNNPVIMVDPWGLEYLVVSGSEYDNNRWKYNFIEPAIKKVKDLKALNDGESIVWIVSATGYSDEALQAMNDLAYELGVGFKKIYSAAELQNYINSKHTDTWDLSNERINDPIRKFVVFSHGLSGKVALGHNQWNASSLNLDYNWIQGLYSQAFDNPNSMFYSCNTGTDASGWGTNFAQNWVNLVGGKTWAAQEKTDYANIMNPFKSNKWTRNNLFSKGGADNYPTTSSGKPFGYFYR